MAAVVVAAMVFVVVEGIVDVVMAMLEQEGVAVKEKTTGVVARHRKQQEPGE